MQATCNVLNQGGSFHTAVAGSSYSQVANILMQAGLAQEAQNTLNSAAVQSTLQAKAACFTPGTEYIDPVLASVTFPFSTNAAGNLILLAPGAMTHPEALFANINYKADYCTADPSCTGIDFNTIFGMTAAPSATVLAKNSSSVYDDVSELFVPSAHAMALMLEGGTDVAHALDTYSLGVGMIKTGVVVPTAVYAGSLNGVPLAQAAANANYAIPVTPGSTGPVIDPTNGLFPNGLGLTINIRAVGSGSGCPVKYCKADELPTDTLFE